ncbi:ribonuclease Z [Gracilibacillus kekensis]|uniref:Ribonuclease Z n=1 Tax=Gracilibacillus kekensis TaxID=1027249 RepID=A0A1M7PSZ8_9BACI|nr:ribonuclease Z [Gracilibacillus kekensis]SHN20599.1 RNAse Z [Gracilibacillus kekensis]
MKVTFLGTGAGLPSKNRNVTSIVLDLLQENNTMWMFDCGEATQHQILHTTIKPRKIERIFITHLHGDHIFGLPGLLSSRSFQGGEKPITIYGPTGIRKFIETTILLSESKLSYPINIIEIDEGIIFENEQFIVTARKLDHGVESFGFRIDEKDTIGPLLVDKLKADGIDPGPVYQLFKKEEYVELQSGTIVRSADYIGESKKGKSVAIFGDTRPKTELITFLSKIDLLVHEATFAQNQEQLALDYFHSTTEQVASIAAKANVKKLILTHISSRFQADDIDQLVAEAKEHFQNTTIAYDFYSYQL